MYNSDQLENLLPADFLAWQNFNTGFDRNDAYAKEQYAKGLRIGQESVEIGISYNGTWYACGYNRVTSSYERIGYHRSTDQLLRGLLDSGCKFVVHRYNHPALEITIKG